MGYTLEKFSKILKIPLSTLAGYERGVSPIPSELREIIKEKLKLSDKDFEPDALNSYEPSNARVVSLKDEPIKRRVPVVSWALAGAMEGRGAFEDLANQIDETVETTSRDPNAFAIEISGDSMDPTVSHRDCVVLEPNMDAPNGWPVLVKLIDGRVFFKRLYRTSEKVILESDNSAHPDLEFEQSEIAFVYPAKDIVKTAQARPRRLK